MIRRKWNVVCAASFSLAALAALAAVTTGASITTVPTVAASISVRLGSGQRHLRCMNVDPEGPTALAAAPLTGLARSASPASRPSPRTRRLATPRALAALSALRGCVVAPAPAPGEAPAPAPRPPCPEPRPPPLSLIPI